jgi:hypothetical protein
MRLGTVGCAEQAAKDCSFRPGSDRVLGRGTDDRSARLASAPSGPAPTTAAADVSRREPTAGSDDSSSSEASAAAAQYARSLVHECRSRLLRAHRRRDIADRICDRHPAPRRRPGCAQRSFSLTGGNASENPLRRAARSSTPCRFSIAGRRSSGGARAGQVAEPPALAPCRMGIRSRDRGMAQA